MEPNRGVDRIYLRALAAPESAGYNGGMKRKMGTFSADCEVASHAHRHHWATVKGALVDTGSEHTWIARSTLMHLGVVPEKQERFMMANGEVLTRDIGFAVLRVAGRITTDEIVFALPGDFEILGARTMEGLNLTVDPRGKRLIPAGPHPAASGRRELVGRAVGGELVGVVDELGVEGMLA